MPTSIGRGTWVLVGVLVLTLLLIAFSGILATPPGAATTLYFTAGVCAGAVIRRLVGP